MNYCKITKSKTAQTMPNPFYVTVANPNEEQKAQLAAMFGWLKMVYTDAPEYDPETQYATDWWQEENGKAVQHWEVHDLPPQPEPEPTIEERVDNLEGAVEGIISGETGENG